ncbi:MAG: hypothetical protein LBI28_06835 [Treponema sp.]|jgi:hypothetical protein|nr:hypothetical protein [Treponema sp.]
MEELKLVKFFLTPIFQEYDYKIKKISDGIRFQFNKNENIHVDFIFMNMADKRLETTIRHPKIRDCVNFPYIINGPESICWNSGRGMGYDSLDDLLGLLEFQMRCFKKWIFDFLAENSYGYIFDILREQREEVVNKPMSQDEMSLYLDKVKKQAKEIRARRYKPDRWSLDEYRSVKK